MAVPAMPSEKKRARDAPATEGDESIRPRKHRHRMLEAEPEEEGVDRQDDGDEEQPPDAKIFPAVIALLFVVGKAGVLRRPDDRLDLLGGRSGESGGHGVG